MDEVRDPIQLRCVGFCGADDTVDPAELKAISEQHGWVEWGVLFRPEKAGSPRFASDEWLKRLGQVNSAGRMRLAGHLCATHVDDLLRGDTSFVRKLHEVLRPPAGPSRHAHPSHLPPRLPARLAASLRMCLRRRDGSFHPAYIRARATATQPHPPRRPTLPPPTDGPATACSATHPLQRHLPRGPPSLRGAAAGGLPAGAGQRDRRQRCRRHPLRRCAGSGGVRRGAAAGDLPSLRTPTLTLTQILTLTLNLT